MKKIVLLCSLLAGCATQQYQAPKSKLVVIVTPIVEVEVIDTTTEAEKADLERRKAKYGVE